MLTLIILSTLILLGFTLLGLIVGFQQALMNDPALEPILLRQGAFDGLALGLIVVASYWLAVIAYGVSE